MKQQLGSPPGMIGVLVVTHGNLGKELVDIAQAIVGEIPFLEWIGVFPEDTPSQIADQIDSIVNRWKKEEIERFLILTDMFGGTPSNLALPYLGEHSEVVSGTNLPMLIKIHQNRDEPSLRKLAKLAQTEAQKNIFIASELLGKRSMP
jgi:PTS system mannose-specific IIA component